MIHVSDLRKVYTAYERGSSFGEALLSLIVRKKKTVEAVRVFPSTLKRANWLDF